MPRPQRCRRICIKPAVTDFCPANGCNKAPVCLTLDEYEVIRLVDLLQQTHEQCARQMDISRSTVQEIYESARKKIAAMLVYGRALEISGGNFRICNGQEQANCFPCGKNEQHTDRTEKGVLEMKIAVAYQEGQIFQHFGHTEQFKIYTVENGTVTGTEVVNTCGSGHGALAGFLMQQGVDTLICGGIGGGAQAALANAGIQLYGGVSGAADEAVLKLLAGNLNFNPNVRCSHHDSEHGEGGHTCGEHGCGNHGCGNHGCR